MPMVEAHWQREVSSNWIFARRDGFFWEQKLQGLFCQVAWMTTQTVPRLRLTAPGKARLGRGAWHGALWDMQLGGGARARSQQAHTASAAVH